jgi:hypothetical protein
VLPEQRGAADDADDEGTEPGVDAQETDDSELHATN